jgi:hypothetical protein
LIVEQAFVLAQELESAVDSAPRGQVVDRCESLLLGHGRDFLRRAMESSLQSRAPRGLTLLHDPCPIVYLKRETQPPRSLEDRTGEPEPWTTSHASAA